MNVGVWVELPCGLDKGVDEFSVLFAADTFLPKAEVEIIVEKLLVICAAVEDYR